MVFVAPRWRSVRPIAFLPRRVRGSIESSSHFHIYTRAIRTARLTGAGPMPCALNLRRIRSKPGPRSALLAHRDSLHRLRGYFTYRLGNSQWIDPSATASDLLLCAGPMSERNPVQSSFVLNCRGRASQLGGDLLNGQTGCCKLPQLSQRGARPELCRRSGGAAAAIMNRSTQAHRPRRHEGSAIAA
jgi:hypothetical protein